MSWLETAAKAQQGLGYLVAGAGSLLPGNQRAGSGGGSLGAQIASGSFSNPNLAFPSLVKTANAQVLSAQDEAPNFQTYNQSSQPMQSTLSGSGGSANTNNNPYQGLSDAANQQTDAELSSVLSEYDYTRGNLQNQLSSADRQRGEQLGYIDTLKGQTQSQVGNQKMAAETNKESEIDEAASTANSVERRNRGVLRALGILNSTAGAELLSQSGNEFGKQRAQIVTATRQRLNELDDFLNSKMSELNNAATQIQGQYTDLVSQIQNDLRFNDRQRTDAIKQANAALSQRIAEIQSAAAQWKSQVSTAQNSTLAQVQELLNYSLPTNDIGGIGATAINAGTGPSARTVGTVQDDKEKLSNVLFNTASA